MDEISCSTAVKSILTVHLFSKCLISGNRVTCINVDSIHEALSSDGCYYDLVLHLFESVPHYKTHLFRVFYKLFIDQNSQSRYG